MRPRALVLGGGGAYGAWQAGVIAALADAGCRWTAIYGASIGAVNGAFLASTALEHQHDQTKLLAYRWSKITNRDIYRTSWRTIFDMAFSTLPLSAAPSLSEGNRLHSFIHKYVAKKAALPFAFTVTDLEAGDSVVVRGENSDDMRPWVAASCSIPVLFPPVVIKHRRYVDGGTLDNDPIDVALADGHTDIDVVLCSAFPRRWTEARQLSLLDTAYLAVRDVMGAHSVASVEAAKEGHGASVQVYAPPEDLGGSLLNFDPQATTAWLKKGYDFGAGRGTHESF